VLWFTISRKPHSPIIQASDEHYGFREFPFDNSNNALSLSFFNYAVNCFSDHILRCSDGARGDHGVDQICDIWSFQAGFAAELS
jgi:hypothetical protein